MGKKVETKTEKQTGGKEVETKTYSYNRVWSEKAINSGNFKESAGHTNPGVMPYESSELYARNVNVGAFKLTDAQVKMIEGSEALALTDKEFQEMPADIRGKGQVANNILYIGKNPILPKSAMSRFRSRLSSRRWFLWWLSKTTAIQFQSYRTEEDTEILLLENGQLDAARMFQNAQDANTMRTWLVRLLGFFSCLPV